MNAKQAKAWLFSRAKAWPRSLAAACAAFGVALSASADDLVLSGPSSSEVTVLDDGDAVMTITGSGKVKVTGSGTAWVLVVGGGGGGGIFAGGGGGGGAVVEQQAVELTAGEYDIVVGAGGSGATTNLTIDALCPATNGGESSAFGLVAAGGGAGGGGSGSGYNSGNNFAWPGGDGEDGTGGGGGGGGLLGGGKGETDTAHGGNGGRGVVVIRYRRVKYGLLMLVR